MRFFKQYTLPCVLLTGILNGTACTDLTVQSAEFVSLSACLRGVARETHSRIADTTRNTPDEVAGVLANGQHFSCQKQVTGTKGTYYLGWYTE